MLAKKQHYIHPLSQHEPIYHRFNFILQLFYLPYHVKNRTSLRFKPRALQAQEL